MYSYSFKCIENVIDFITFCSLKPKLKFWTNKRHFNDSLPGFQKDTLHREGQMEEQLGDPKETSL